MPRRFFTLLGIYALPIAAFGGGLATTLLLYRIATGNGQTSVATMLLAGIALGALAGALTGLLIYMANDQQLRDLTFWGMGSLAGATWIKIAAAAPHHSSVLRRATVHGPRPQRHHARRGRRPFTWASPSSG